MMSFFKLPPAFQINTIFFAGMAFLVMIFSSKVPSWTNFFVLYASMAVGQVFLSKIPNTPFISFIKNIYFPTFSVLVAFDTIGELVPLINPGDIDHILLELDYKILGFYPYLSLQQIQSPIITEIMQMSYCVYYIMPFTIGIYLLIKKDKAEFHRALFLLLLCYYLSYIGYILFPALGPRFILADGLKPLKGLLFAENINSFLNYLEGIKRDAFPSGHVAISLVVLHIMWKNSKKLFYIFLLPVTLLIASTVYCRYHYFVDVLGGFALTVVTLLIGNLYYNFWLVKNGSSFFKR